MDPSVGLTNTWEGLAAIVNAFGHGPTNALAKDL
jgi:hypothetical protein